MWLKNTFIWSYLSTDTHFNNFRKFSRYFELILPLTLILSRLIQTKVSFLEFFILCRMKGISFPSFLNLLLNYLISLLLTENTSKWFNILLRDNSTSLPKQLCL